jgi:hypothetical protein
VYSVEDYQAAVGASLLVWHEVSIYWRRQPECDYGMLDTGLPEVGEKYCSPED